MKAIQSHGFVKLLAMFLLAAVLFVTLHFAVNVPHGDDYELILRYLTEHKEIQGFWRKLLHLFEERNEHRGSFLYAYTVLDHAIFGEVNLVRFVIINNISLAGIIYLLYSIFRTTNKPAQYFIPIVLFLVIPYPTVMNWASAGMIYLPCVFFALLALFLLRTPTLKNVVLALLAAALSSSILIGGFLTFIAAVPFFIRRHPKKHAIIWIAGTIITIVIYLIGFHPEKHTDVASNILSGPHIILLNFIAFYGQLSKSLLGGYYTTSMILGLCILLISSFLVYKHRSKIKESPLLYSGLLLGLGLGVIISIGRAHLGVGATIAFRYIYFQTLLPVFAYLIYIKHGEYSPSLARWLIGISVVAVPLIWSYQIKSSQKINSKLSNGMYGYLITDSAEFLPVKNANRHEELLREARKNQIYNPNMANFRPMLSLGSKTNHRLLPTKYKIGTEKNSEDYYILTGWAFLAFHSQDNLTIKLALKSKRQTYYMETGPLHQSKSIEQNSANGFVAIIDKHRDDLPADNYQLSVVLIHPLKGIVGEADLDKTIATK